MMDSRPPEDAPQAPNEGIAAADAAGLSWLEEALRAECDQVEEDVRGWIADLKAATTAFGDELGSQNNRRLSVARERLERLEKALHQAPEIVERLRRRTAEYASVSAAQLRRLGDHEVAERKLASANDQLQQEISLRERLETKATEVEQGLREVRERFKSAFNNPSCAIENNIEFNRADRNRRWHVTTGALIQSCQRAHAVKATWCGAAHIVA